MDKFTKHIKDTLENYEAPYSDEVWLNIKDKLPKKSNNFLKYSTVATIIAIIAIVGFILYIPKQESIVLLDKIETPIKTTQPTEQKIQIQEKITKPKNFIIKDTMRRLQLSEKEIEIVEEEIVEDEKKDTIIISPEEVIYTLKDTFIEQKQDTPVVITTPIQIVEEKIKYFIPTAFTPNNDGLNDEFTIFGENIDELSFELLVYDRWGKLVFETINSEYKWNGENCDTGAYAWLLRIQEDDGKITIDKGTITIIR